MKRWVSCAVLALVLLGCGGDNDEDTTQGVADALEAAGDDIACDTYERLVERLRGETPENETVAVQLDFIATAATDPRFVQQAEDAAAEVRGGTVRGEEFDALADYC